MGNRDISSADRYDGFVTLTTEAAVASSKDELYEVVARSVPNILGVRRASMALLTSAEQFEVVAFGGAGDVLQSGERIELAGTAIDWTLREGRCATTNEHELGDFRDWRMLNANHELTQFVISPMLTARGPIGTFNIGLPTEAVVNDELISAAGTFAKVLASHLELHNNIETLQQTVDDLSTAQNQLVEQAKNAALGEMLSGLAHEVNTPLSVVGNAISLTTDSVSELKGMMLEGRLTRDGFKQWHTDANHFLDLGRQNLGRAIRIMTELKSVSLEHHVNSVEAVQLIEHVERVKLLLNPLSRSHGIEIEIEGDPVAVETSPGKLHQAIVNLIQNAAIHGYEGAGGKVSIRIARTKTGAQIQVQDFGRGMSPEIQRKALEPFFTTKRGKGGTGLGLHLTATNISEIGGRLSLDSKEGQGTTFTLLLPQYQPDRG